MAAPARPMTLSQSFFLIGLLIVASAFFSVAEISLAASRRLRLRQLADEGEARAESVMRMQEQPGDYFTVVQVGQNAVAILGGIVGEGALSPQFTALLQFWLSDARAETFGFLASFLTITSLFILFADLFPKRLGMVNSERLAVVVARPMAILMAVLRPVVWLYSRAADLLFRVLGLSSLRDDRITSDDILAMMEAGTRAGVLAAREQQVIENVFELDSRPVSSAMSPRDRIAFFLRDDPDQLIRARIAAEPFSTYPVCEGDIDHVVGYVDAKDLFQRVLNNQPISPEGRRPRAQGTHRARPPFAGRGAGPVPPGARGFRRHRQRVQPRRGRRHPERRDEHGDGRPDRPRRRGADRPARRELLADRRRHARGRRAAGPAPRRTAPCRRIRNPGGLPHGHAAPRAPPHGQRELGRLQVRGARRGQLPHRPDHGVAPAGRRRPSRRARAGTGPGG